MNEAEARKKFAQAYPDFRIEKVRPYDGGFAIQAFDSDPDEGHMDPFYFVDQAGRVRGLPYLLPEHFNRIATLFSS